MTPSRAFVLLNTQLRHTERRARIGTLYLAGPMPTIEQLQDQFAMQRSAAELAIWELQNARAEFGTDAPRGDL